MKQSFDKWGFVGIGPIVALLLTHAGLAYYNTRKMHRDAAQVARTHVALKALEDIDSIMKDAQAGHRGYRLTGDPSYLAPWHNGVAAIAQKVERLACLTAHSPRSQAHLPALRDLATELQSPEQAFTSAEEVDVGTRRTSPTDASHTPVDSIRSHLFAIKDGERRLLKERKRHYDRHYQVAQATCVLTPVVGLTLVGMLICLLRRNQLERATAAEIA